MTRFIHSEKPQNPIRMAEVLAAFSLATDLGAGKPMGHAIRACFLGMEMAGKLRLSTDEQAELYYSYLLMHSGCTVLSLGLSSAIQGDELAAIGDITLQDDTDPLVMVGWIRRHVSPDAPFPMRARNMVSMLLHSNDANEHTRGACEVAVRVAQRLSMPPGVHEAVRHYLERWDGKGPYGLAGNNIPLKSRLLHAALKIEACYTAKGRDAAVAMASAQSGKIFDPRMVDTFLAIAENRSLWETLAKKDLWQDVLGMEPDSPYRVMEEEKLDDIALAVADFVDLKSPHTVGHSRETARLAEQIARRMNIPLSEVANIRRAALVHDLGQIAIPGHILENPHHLSEVDKEKLRLHPYYTERILSRVPAFSAVAAIAGKHHERINGTGYYRGLSGSDLSMSDCVLALADEFQDRMQRHPGRPGPDPKDILREIQPEVGPMFSPECFEALSQELGVVISKAHQRREWPDGLTDREVEVLRLVATGASNRQIARALVISAKTVAHHLEHIYNKIGVSSRAAAVFFAMEHELIHESPNQIQPR